MIAERPDFPVPFAMLRQAGLFTLTGSNESMAIQVGDTIPSMKLMMATPDGPKETSTDDVFKGKKVVLFAVPGAFTPTCSAKHLPGFVQQADALKAKGVDTIACIAVNDGFVMKAWGEEPGRRRQGADAGRRLGGVRQGDGPGARPDRARHGCAQPALCADRAGRQGDALGIEAPGGFEVSSAEAILAAL